MQILSKSVEKKCLQIKNFYNILYHQGGVMLNTYIIRDKDIIMKLTGNSRYNRILLHLDNEQKVVKFEADYTLFELTERLEYNHVISIIKELKMF